MNIDKVVEYHNKKIKILGTQYKQLRTNIIDGDDKLDTEFNKVIYKILHDELKKFIHSLQILIS